VTGASQPLPPDDGNSPPQIDPDGSRPEIGDSCQSNDTNQLCLALKYVVYQDSTGTPVVTDDGTVANLEAINDVWSQCDIAFEIENYEAVDPSSEGLLYHTSTSGQLNTVRSAFEDSRTLLVVTTGNWSGTLGAGSANAWTMMPGGSPYGVVLEAAVASYPNIIAHELGHYLNLDHIADSTEVMNAVIYTSSTQLTSSQCSTARSAAINYWASMLR
jgi:hypothetical protein